MRRERSFQLREEIDRAERRAQAFYVILPYALLTVSTLVTFLDSAWTGTSRPLIAVVVLSVAILGWSFLLTVLPSTWRGRPAVLLGYVGGSWVLTAALVALSPWYGIFAFSGYIHAFLLLAGVWRYLGVVVTSLISAVSYMGGLSRIGADEWWLWLAIGGVTSLLAGTSFYFADTTRVQGMMQKDALLEVQEANARLEAALEENAVLHDRLLGQARDAGVSDERQRIARELHDTLAQSLAGIVTQLQAAEQSTTKNSRADAHVASALRLARESLAEARRTIHAVEPGVLAGVHLPDAIENIANRWSEEHGVPVHVATHGSPRRMRTDVEVALVRAAQEALANVAKHAHAGRVGLTLSYMEDVVTLDVRDDGRGFRPAALPMVPSTDGGFGLEAMRQRVEGLAGRLVVESEPGGGTAISASVPAIPAGAAA